MATHRTLPGYRSIQCLAIVVLFSIIRYSSADCSALNQSKPFIVSENETVGYVVANISVYSLRIDKANFNKYTNLLSATEEAGRWIIKLNEPLDAETMPNVQITFACQDAAGAREQSKPMVLIVQDINEFAPQFSAPDSSVNISENWPVGKPFFTIEAEDIDARKVSVQFVYAVVDGDKGYFNITESKGEVFLVKPLDYETGPIEFTLNISATESLPDGMTNYTSLTISVEDVDDLMPIFTSSVYTLSIPEGNYYGNISFQTTPNLSAQDGDYHINQSIRLQIDHSTNQLYKNLFSVDQNGLVSVNGSLTVGVYTVLIRASQTDQPELRYAIAVLTITVTDINDHVPSLDKRNYSANVSEAAVPGTVLLIVTAYDDDLGNNSEVTFHISQNVTGIFGVDTEYHSGIIRLSGSLDREKKAEYDFQVWAKETMTSEGWESPPSSVKITVLDENDNTPTFSQTEYIFNLTRTEKKGDLVGQIHAGDQDENLNGEVTYTVKTSKYKYLFEINETGNITLKKNLDYQDTGTYNIIVSASDSATVNPRTSYCVVTVNILPVNEHAPSFVNMSYVFHVLETAHVGDFIGQVSAIDVDGDNVVFSMSGNTNYLEISPSSGEITLAHELDLDSKNSATPQNFTVTVTAKDGLHHNITEVEVIILHVNEYSPTFVPHGPFYINDNATTGAVIANVTATDEDVGPDGSVIYSLIQTTTSALFKIDKNSGIITLNCSGQCLDYKRGNYDIIVQASDEGTPPRVSITSVQVQVQKTVFESPEFSEKVYHVILQENSTVQVSLQLSAQDPDTDQSQLQFYLKNLSPPLAPPSSVTVHKNGTVIFSGPFDAEVISSFVVDVAVSDGNSSDSAIIVVNVTDINDHSPALNFTSLKISLPENSTVGTIVTAVRAQDSDVTNSRFYYFLKDGSDGKFNIDLDSGVITLASPLDRRQKTDYNITVIVLDSGTPPYMVTGNITIEVADSNTAPEFVDEFNNSKSSYTFNVKENLTVGDYVGSLYARDPDAGSSGELSFKILTDDSDGTFTLGTDSGNLTLAKPLDHEKKTDYRLSVVVSDNSFERKTATATVTVIVENVVEAPQWPMPLPTVYITQSSSVCKDQQLQVEAISKEVTAVSSHSEASVEYTLLNMTDKFVINDTTGLLKINSTLTSGQHNVGLRACSAGSNACSDAVLTVVVQINKKLAFCPTFYSVEVNESAPVNSLLLVLNTTDDGSTIHYNISKGNDEGKFYIGADSGVLYIAKELDREEIQSYVLFITARDSQEEAQAQVIIRVLDDEDEAPQFSATTYQGEISENQQVESPVYFPSTQVQLVVSATDKDENSKLTYSINPAFDTSNGSFRIDENNATIFLAREVDYDQIPENLNKMYRFEVQVKDGIFVSSVNVTVHILDDNDNEPHFDDPNDLSLNVTEGPSSVTYLTTVAATDQDTHSALKYSLDVVSPTGVTNVFSIDGLSGQLRVIHELDREKVDKYILNVTVTDGKHTVCKLVSVTVLDENDNSPYFNQSHYAMNVTEGNNGFGTNITVQAYDDDTGANADLSYAILSGNINDSFEIDVFRNLRTVKSLDREAVFNNYGTSSFELVIEAKDNGSTAKTGTATVFVTVLDVNDNPPEFSQRKYYATVPKNAHSSTIPVTPPIFVTNVDTIDCPQIVYHLLNVSTPFDLANDSGTLLLIGNLDRETIEHYTLLITAVDDCGEGLTSSAEISVTVTDVTDEPPHFLSSVYKFSIKENSAWLHSVGNVTALDNDTTGSIIVYDFVETSNVFHIDPLKGEIKLIGILDQKKYTLNVSACDDKFQCGFVAVLIDVTDANNRCPVWNATSLNLNVNEGWAPGIIGHILANDDSNVTYFLNDTAADGLIEVSTTGDVNVTKKLKADRSDQHILKFTVFAEDDSQPPCVVPGTIEITVNGVNDNDPEICYMGKCGLKSFELSVFDKSPAGTLVALIVTHDNDTGLDGEVNLSLSSKNTNASDLFQVNSYGIITLKQYIELETLQTDGIIQNNNDTIELFLWATDGGNRTQSANVSVQILNFDSNIPSFTNQSYNLFVQENSVIGTYVGTVTARSGSNSSLNYSISMLDRNVPFAIEQHNGSITTLAILDREDIGLYIFLVQVTDLNHLSASAAVVVKVEDVNEPPKFDDQNVTVTVEENTSKELIKLVAHDHDDGINSNIKYQIDNATMYPNFEINSSSGILSVIQNLDRENRSSYDLIIQAVDDGNPPCTSTAAVHVVVSDLNDNKPLFTQSDYQTNIFRSPPPVKVITMNASDEDNGENGKIFFLLQSNFHTFEIGLLSGVIQTFAIPSEDSYDLVVVATDQGNPPKSSTANVTVKVLENRTDTDAFLTLSKKSIQLFVGMTNGTELDVKIATSDPDSLRLAVSGGNVAAFRIEKGKIILNQDLIQTSTYILTITTSSTVHTVSKELEVYVDIVKFNQTNYVVLVPENKNNTEPILDIDSDAERLGVPVIYSLSSSYSAFYIIKTTGVIWMLHELDRETLPVYVLNVSLHLDPAAHSSHRRQKRAVDTSIGQAFVSVIVRVEDQNDNVPTFGNIGPELHLSVPENVSASYLITTLKAFDPDEGLNGQIIYSVSNGKNDVFELDPVSGELRVASPANLKHQLSYVFTVLATDRNGTGNYSSINVKISVVQYGNQFRLPTPLPLSSLQENLPAIKERLNQILGFNLTTTELTSDGDSSAILFEATQSDGNTTIHLAANQIGEKVLEKQTEIESLFTSFIKEPKTAEKKSMDAESIALIVVACVMFLVSLVAIFIACRMWKKQKKYAQKEENAAKVRRQVEEQSTMGKVKETRLDSDSDEHLEMVVISEGQSTSLPANLEEQTHTIYFDTDSKQLDASGGQNIQQIQRSLQSLEADSKDSGIASPVNTDSEGSGQESPSSTQKSVRSERQKESLEEDGNGNKEREGQGGEGKASSSETNKSREHDTARDESEKEQAQAVPASSLTKGDTSPSDSVPDRNIVSPVGVTVPQSSNNLSSDEATGNSTVTNSTKYGLVMMNTAFEALDDNDPSSNTEAITHF